MLNRSRSKAATVVHVGGFAIEVSRSGHHWHARNIATGKEASGPHRIPTINLAAGVVTSPRPTSQLRSATVESYANAAAHAAVEAGDAQAAGFAMLLGWSK